MRKSSSAFTIVELLIVIVVIAVLAVISVVAYNGIQARAQDTAIKNGANEFAKALINWRTLTGRTTPNGGYGNTQQITSDGYCPENVSGGWVTQGTYVCTVEEELTFQKLLPSGFTSSLPSNKFLSAANGRLTLMLYRCVISDDTWVVLFYLNSPSVDDVSNYTSLAAKCTSANLPGYRNNYGMQGALLINLS